MDDKTTIYKTARILACIMVMAFVECYYYINFSLVRLVHIINRTKL